MRVDSNFVATLAPLLAPNKILGMDIPFSQVKYPKLCSIKYNGIRCMMLGGRMISRSGKSFIETKQINPFVHNYFEPILEWAHKHKVVLDGEFHSNTHNTVGQTRSILAGTLPLPDDFTFKCFYEIPYPVWNTTEKISMSNLIATSLDLPRYMPVKQTMLLDDNALQELIFDYKNRNIEGFMLLDPHAYYKHSAKCTIGEQILLKFKYYSDEEDAKVVGLTARRERRADVAMKIGTYGKAEQVYTKDSFQDTNIAGCIVAELENGEIVNTPFPVGWTLEDRQKAFEHFGTGLVHDIKGEWICFRRLNCEDRDKPISIKGVQFRDRKD